MTRHMNPTTTGFTATAPYNFVPLPNQVYTVDDRTNNPWETHDRFQPGNHSGWINLSIQTLSPLFIRGPILKTNNSWDNRDSRFRQDPFVSSDGKPMIPGSSLRGMIRNLVEIISFSKISPVTHEKPFFRTVGNDRIGIAYRNRMIRNNQKPSGGFIQKSGEQWTIVPAKEILRVSLDLLRNLDLNIFDKPNPNYYPDWNGQHKECWFKRDVRTVKNITNISLSPTQNWEQGTLVLTGSAPKKKADFIFLDRDVNRKIPIPKKIWDRFHDQDQLTQWQERSFPKNKPNKNCRRSHGHLRDGEPIFYLVEETSKNEENPDGLVFFGRAQMFRFPYDLSPIDLIPEPIKDGGLDLAESVFGTVRKEKTKKEQAIKGRVFFENAIAKSGGPKWFENIIVPRILSSPKVTSFQHYLTQDGTQTAKEMTTYLNGDQTSIRGHKLYWHRWDNEGLNAVKEPIKHDQIMRELQSGETKDTQHTIIKPIKSGVVFSGRIRFVNLTTNELGALLCALKLPDQCAHRLGMAKPLGLGSVKIVSELQLIDREKRYSCWEHNGISEHQESDFMRSFEKEMLNHAEHSDEALDETQTGLDKIARIQTLFNILKWDNKPARAQTDYMLLSKNRLVLPTPHKVLGITEPKWKKDPPKPAPEEEDKGISQKKRQQSPIKKTDPPPSKGSKSVQKGQNLVGELSYLDNRWIASFADDSRNADIVNLQNIILDQNKKYQGEFYISEQSKKIGIKARLEKIIKEM